MGKLYLVMGKSATGKDHIFKDVVAGCPTKLRTVVPYTTRPRRINETEGVEYHFVSEERMHEMEAQGRILECRCYDTVYGPWYYFTADDGQIQLEDHSSIVIVTPEAYRQIREHFGAENIVPLYIEVDDGERLARALKRERKQEQPKYAEMCRRFLADSVDFSEEVLAELGIHKRFVNVVYDDCVREVIDEIMRYEGEDAKLS